MSSGTEKGGHSPDCIFCKLAQKQIPTQVIYEDEDFLVFPDLAPQAKIHWLIIPKHHVQDVLALAEQEGRQGGEGEAESQTQPSAGGYMDKLLQLLPRLAKLAQVEESGFRLLTNCGSDAGQTVFHLHFHFLAGEALAPHFA